MVNDDRQPQVVGGTFSGSGLPITFVAFVAELKVERLSLGKLTY